MTHRGPFQPLPFCDSVILCFCVSFFPHTLKKTIHNVHPQTINNCESYNSVTIQRIREIPGRAGKLNGDMALLAAESFRKKRLN